MGHEPLLAVKVWGDYACFTRPEFRSERVSYDVMTPSAARGILEAIFWKPEFVWQVYEIHLLKQIRHFSIVRNEINSWQSDRAAKDPRYHYYADDDRAQRHLLGLRDVAYIIKADIALKSHAKAHPAKYRDQFRRRIKRGQCHHRPYLGTREFSAFFAAPEPNEPTIDDSNELGLMLLDLDFIASGQRSTMVYLTHDETGAHVTQGIAQPKFFSARLDKGVLRVPQG